MYNNYIVDCFAPKFEVTSPFIKSELYNSVKLRIVTKSLHYIRIYLMYNNYIVDCFAPKFGVTSPFIKSQNNITQSH